jgi:branched-chain amino acid transport system permease protein
MTVPSLANTVTIPFTVAQFPLYRIFVIFFVLVVAAGFFYFDRTRLGAIIRAGMDDSQMVEGMGINVTRIHIFVFAAAAVAAGLAAGLALPVFGNSYQAGFDILLMALIVTVVGGMGSVLGAFVFSMAAGIITTWGKFLFPEAAMFLLYGLMVIVLAFRPSGLFGR